jgi:hypothetical protein
MIRSLQLDIRHNLIIFYKILAKKSIDNGYPILRSRIYKPLCLPSFGRNSSPTIRYVILPKVVDIE